MTAAIDLDVWTLIDPTSKRKIKEGKLHVGKLEDLGPLPPPRRWDPKAPPPKPQYIPANIDGSPLTPAQIKALNPEQREYLEYQRTPRALK